MNSVFNLEERSLAHWAPTRQILRLPHRRIHLRSLRPPGRPWRHPDPT